jgi:hypothetical protein
VSLALKLVVAAALAVLASGCSRSESAERADTSASAADSSIAVPPVSLDWDALRNPIYAPAHMVKDIAVVVDDGVWYLYGSEKWEPNETDDRHAVASRDLVDWTAVGATQDEVFDSPDVTRGRDGRWVITHQRAFGNGDAATHRIVASTATSIVGPWSAPRQVATDVFPGARLIDGAIAHTDTGLYLVAKRGDRTQVPQFAEMLRSPSGSLDGPWVHLGTADVGWTENFQFLQIDGTWHMLVTTIPVHVPVLYALAGDPEVPSSWLHWRMVRELNVPEEAWNSAGEPEASPGFTHERANSAYLVDARTTDGHFYLFYAGSTELTTHDGRGLAHIGVARSRDLITWSVPGAAHVTAQSGP